MIKKTLLILLSIVTFSVSAQSISIERLNTMSDKELMSYVKQYESQGVSIDNLIGLAKARGASDADIAKVKARIEGIGKSSNAALKNNTTKSVETSFGYTEPMREKTVSDTLPKIFGSEFFLNPNITLAPALNLATPKNYQLGPGDEISISVYGAANNTYDLTVSKEGTVNIESLPPIYLSGKTITEAKSYLTKRLEAIYSGLNLKSNQEGKVDLDLSLLKMRSIVIGVVGQANVPGNYTLNGATSPVNALFAAGGINRLGSYRNITIVRNNKTIAEIDLYHFLVNGISPNISLRDQDVILVPYATKQVYIEEGFKKTGVFELKNEETLSELLQFNGGFLANASKESISIGRFKNGNISQESVFSDAYDNYIPKDGDRITSALYDTYVANRVSISGAVKVPGSFNILNANTAYDLIKLSKGLREDALKDLALLYRKENGIEKLIEGISLSKIIAKEINYPLKEGDRLEVLSVKETVQDKFVSILGAVKSPNKYKFYQGMTPLDLIYLAGGQNVNINPVVSIYRQSTNNNSGLESLEIDITGDLNLLPKLNEDDVVVVREKKYETLNTVLINGPVKNPGVYGLRINMNLESLIEEAGGLLDFANKDGIFIKRVLDQKVLEAIKEKVAKDSIAIDQELLNKNYLEVSVDIKKAGNIFLKKGDVINILEKDNSVTVQGAVNQETAFNFKNQTTLKAINNAGGFTDNARKSKVYVIYANKSVRATNSFLFFKKYPKLKPGATVVVPIKGENNNKLSTQEVLGITSGISTLGILIRTLLGF